MSDRICPRAGKWLRGCRFEGRYEYGRPDKFEFGWGTSPDDAEMLMRATRPKVYVRDICVVCGRVVDRKGDAGGNSDA